MKGSNSHRDQQWQLASKEKKEASRPSRNAITRGTSSTGTDINTMGSNNNNSIINKQHLEYSSMSGEAVDNNNDNNAVVGVGASNRENGSNNNNNNNTFIRVRADSDGSTRDAFYASVGPSVIQKKVAPPPPPLPTHRRPHHSSSSSKKNKKKKNEATISVSDSTTTTTTRGFLVTEPPAPVLPSYDLHRLPHHPNPMHHPNHPTSHMGMALMMPSADNNDNNSHYYYQDSNRAMAIGPIIVDGSDGGGSIKHPYYVPSMQPPPYNHFYGSYRMDRNDNSSNYDVEQSLYHHHHHSSIPQQNVTVYGSKGSSDHRLHHHLARPAQQQRRRQRRQQQHPKIQPESARQGNSPTSDRETNQRQQILRQRQQQQQQQQQEMYNYCDIPDEDGKIVDVDDDSNNNYEYGMNQTDAISTNEDKNSDSSIVPPYSNFVARRISDYLVTDAKYDETGSPYFEKQKKIHYSLATFVRHFFYNPITPEFTSLQQFMWAIVIGIIMGFYTAMWKWYIDYGVQFFWRTIPKYLLQYGICTSMTGTFPLHHYMWILPAILGSIVSYMFVILPIKIPTQDEWICNVHSRGVQDHRTFFPLFFLSTAAMWSGLSLGPELPLVLTAGMAGSWLAIVTKQSMLQARVLNLTAASAAIGGFFGFPMAGALFVLELPHRMGLQYFEALSPGTIASIVAVLANRLVTGDDVTGYFSYPFLSSTLPSSIFKGAILYGFYGCFVGILYVHIVKKTKVWVHEWFHPPSHPRTPIDDVAEGRTSSSIVMLGLEQNVNGEMLPLLSKVATGEVSNASHSIAFQGKESNKKWFPNMLHCIIRDRATRAAVSGALAGAIIGVIGMFVPHTLFWGEAQLQNLIDKGRTPLPIFGNKDDEVSSFLTTFAVCMIDPNDSDAIKAGFSIGCSSLIIIMKMIVIGLSLGTGIIGGQFWGPLYVGCAAGHLLTDLCIWVDDHFGYGRGLALHPCVVLLCTMGSTHVVTFRAHMAIMLILTLTISAFDEKDDPSSALQVAGDYSAVFPLLVVSVFISLMVSRDTIFYAAQCSRGDITAVPEVLCQPGKAGAPVVMRYHSDDSEEYLDDHKADSSEGSAEETESSNDYVGPEKSSLKISEVQETPHVSQFPVNDMEAVAANNTKDRLDELLSKPIEENVTAKSSHRRCQSLPYSTEGNQLGNLTVEDFSVSVRSSRRKQLSPVQLERKGTSSLVRVPSFGDLQDHQPSLLDQARLRSASSAGETRHRRVPSLPTPASISRGNSSLSGTDSPGGRRGSVSSRHSRKNSNGSTKMGNHVAMSWAATGALSLDDIDRSFHEVLNTKPPTTPSSKLKKSPVTQSTQQPTR